MKLSLRTEDLSDDAKRAESCKRRRDNMFSRAEDVFVEADCCALEGDFWRYRNQDALYSACLNRAYALGGEWLEYRWRAQVQPP